MRTIYGLEGYSEKRRLYLALGNFDGIHRGHQVVISSAVNRARASGGAAGVLLFEPHPFLVLHPERHFCLLTGMEERSALMKQLGVDYLFVEPFTEETSLLSAEEFIRNLLLQRFHVAGVSIGDDYSFGKGAAGHDDLMQECGKIHGFEVMVSPMEKAGSGVISTSAIKKLLEAGDVEQAALLLNYYFHRRGKIIKGHGRGKRLLYPTANISFPRCLVCPGSGVYLTALGGLEHIHYGLTNVGTNPTFNDGVLSIESHILDFEGDLYGRELTLYFLLRLRRTREFSSAALLREQIENDIKRGREIARRLFAGIADVVEPPRFIRPPGA